MELFKKANGTKIKSKGTFIYEYRGLWLGNKNTAEYRKIYTKKKEDDEKDGFKPHRYFSCKKFMEHFIKADGRMIKDKGRFALEWRELFE